MVSFEFVNPLEFDKYSEKLFAILADNMSKIRPTGGTYEEDFLTWIGYQTKAVIEENQKTILIFDEENVIGYFAYVLEEDSVLMESIQFSENYHGKDQIFRKLYGFFLGCLPEKILYVTAYSDKLNLKSQGILKRFGLEKIGENKSGKAYLYKGTIVNLKDWYNKKI